MPKKIHIKKWIALTALELTIIAIESDEKEIAQFWWNIFLERLEE